MQAVPITTKVVSSNSVIGEVDSIQHYLIVCRWFSPRTLVSYTNKTDHHVITEILLKVTLNTITLTPYTYYIHITKEVLYEHSANEAACLLKLETTCVARSFVFYVPMCRSLFVHMSILAIVLSVLHRFSVTLMTPFFWVSSTFSC